MNTYKYRELRRQRVEAVLNALPVPEPGNIPELWLTLSDERESLGGDDWTMADRTFLAVAEDWFWRTRANLKTLADNDPVFLALGNPSTLSDAQASSIENIPQETTSPVAPDGYLERVRTVLAGEESVFDDLVQTVHFYWWKSPAAAQPYPYDDVGVVLPLRLETLFDEPKSTFNPDPTRWQMSLRVIPDEVSICRDDTHVSPGERNALVAFWQAVKQPGVLSETWLDGPEAGIAWQQLASRVTAPRAAWLVANLTPHIQGDAVDIALPADMPVDPLPNRVGGLPPEMRVYLINSQPMDGSDQILVGRLFQDPFIRANHQQLPLPLPGSKEDMNSWWASWEKAKSVGLGDAWLLPEGVTPQTIRALYVVGIGDETPDAHFKAQVDSGEMGILRLGAPTNAVHGKATGGAGQADADWRKVAQMRLSQQLNPQQAISMPAGLPVLRALTGSDNGLPFFPGADGIDETQLSRHMSSALWPAIYGTWFHEIYKKDDSAFRLGIWAAQYLYPEGPLMPLRIADQPYGLLPVTAISQWVIPDPTDSESLENRNVEAPVASALATLRAFWAEAAEGKGTVVGKTSSEFMDLLGQEALSSGYFFRTYANALDWIAAYALPSDQQNEFKDRVTRMYVEPGQHIELDAGPSLLAYGWPWENELPLVQPARMVYQDFQERRPLPLQDFIKLLFDHPDVGVDALFDSERFNSLLLHVLPDSLLIRLLTYACQIAAHWRNIPLTGNGAQMLLDFQFKEAGLIAELLDRPEWRDVVKDPQTGRPSAFLLRMPDEQRAQFERALRATLDTAAHRIDPWITGFAWQRLQQHSTSPRRSHRMAVYGWLDGPFLGSPGPTDAGRLHTPSFNQTLAALILRDKFLSSGRAVAVNDGGHNPWDMNINSSKARLAAQIVEEVRMGFHIYEVLGRLVEHIIAQPQRVRELRCNSKYAMRTERLDPNEVCNGMEALKGLLAGDPDFPLDPDQIQALEHLDAALDTYGDLLVADGIMQVVNRQLDRAAETLDAAAGFSRPPSFEFLRTPPSGYLLDSVVLSTLQFVPVDALGLDASPVRIADPSMAAFLESKFSNGWTWRATNADAGGAVIGEVSLAELGLAPVDAIVLSADLIGDLARHKLGLPLVYISESANRVWMARDAQGNPLGETSLVELSLTPQTLAGMDDVALGARIRVALGLGEDALISEIIPADPRLWIVRDENGALLGMVSPAGMNLAPADVDALEKDALYRLIRQKLGLAQVVMVAPRQHALALELVAALSSRPASARDLGGESSAQADAAIYAELRGRYEKLFAAGQQTSLDLRAAAAADDGTGVARAAALRRALAWGLAPVSEPADRAAFLAALSGSTPPQNAMPLDQLCNAVADVLDKRLEDAVQPGDLITPEQIGAPLDKHKDLKQKNIPDGVPTLARALANLAAPNAKLALLAFWPRDLLMNRSGIGPEQADPNLDESWLTVAAAVRPNLARLEAIQLELAEPLEAWSSSPGDPWQRTLVQENLYRRDGKTPPRENESPLGLKTDGFTAAYGTAGAWAGDSVAVGLVDAFSEAVPMPHRTTMTAFGFNAPAARAPQAILLAVPPRPRQRLDEEVLLQICIETRRLAHARLAHAEDLGAFQALTPTMLLQVNGPVRAWLEPWPLFE